jgi:hypothetical protein
MSIIIIEVLISRKDSVIIAGVKGTENADPFSTFHLF